MEKDFTSIAEMDQFFEANKVEVKEETPPEVEVPEVEVVEEIPELDATDEESTQADEATEDEEDEVEEEVSPKTKPTKEDKRDFAFSKLRKESAEAKKAFEEQNALVQRLMKEAGYKDYDKFKEALDKQFSEKEMKEKGYTKDQYNEVEVLKQQNKELEAKLEQTSKRELTTKAQNFDKMVRTYAGQYKVSAKDIYESLDESGFTAELLLNLPNPEVLIRGVMADKVKPVEKPIKKAVDTEKLPSGSAGKSEVNFDDLLKADLEAYKARKGNA